MALQHILDAIVNDANNRIQQINANSKKHLKDAQEASEKRLTDSRKRIAESVDQKKRQLKEKTLSYALMHKRKVLLENKQQHMDDLYNTVLQKLTELPKDHMEKLLKACLGTLPSSGIIRPSAAHEAMLKKLLPKDYEMGEAIAARGGFIFSNDTQEYNFTFEHIVHNILRPATEVHIAHEIFQQTT
jgi:vacuolar-type H+-ATPase subunit E/Vma4